MIDITTSLIESEVTAFSYKLQEFAADIDDVREGVKGISILDSIDGDISKTLSSGDLNLFDKFVSCSLLGQLYTTKRCLTLPPEKAYYNHELVMREVYYYRMLLKLTKEVVDRGLISLYATAQKSRYRAIVLLCIWEDSMIILDAFKRPNIYGFKLGVLMSLIFCGGTILVFH